MKWVKGLIVLSLVAVAALWLAGMRPGRGQLEVSVVIDKPPAVVFAALMNPEITLKWVSGIKEIKQLTPDLGKVGSKLMLIGNGADVLEEITHLQSPYLGKFTALGKQFTQDGEYRLEEVKGKTKFTIVSKIEYHGFLHQFLEPLLVWRARHKLEGDQKRLKAILELS